MSKRSTARNRRKETGVAGYSGHTTRSPENSLGRFRGRLGATLDGLH